MNTIIKKITILAFFFLLFSCTSNDVPDNSVETIFLKAKIDGADFSSDFPVLTQLTNTFAISATTSDNQDFLQIYIADYTGPGTYTAGSTINNENAFLYTNSGSWFANKDYESGTVTINRNGNVLTGTFSFTAFNFSNSTTKTITDGSFKIILP